MHAKLDELLRSEEHASKELAVIEELEAEELIALKLRLARSRLRGTGRSDDWKRDPVSDSEPPVGRSATATIQNT
jgi:low affinity Fe/Cu permease